VAVLKRKKEKTCINEELKMLVMLKKETGIGERDWEAEG
jgi:hypothetical protein